MRRYFNSRPRVGGVLMLSRRLSQILFQFSPPRGGRPLISSSPGIWRTNFNSRPRVGGVSLTGYDIPEPYLFQFSPPRGGRPKGDGSRDFDLLISILAPAWGASLDSLQNSVSVNISILAPAWGASVLWDNACAVLWDISILAPAWGASCWLG